jgi:hypothetical protein
VEKQDPTAALHAPVTVSPAKYVAMLQLVTAAQEVISFWRAVHEEPGRLGAIRLANAVDKYDDASQVNNEVGTWPLCTLEDGEYGGGVWCGDEDCPLQAENAEIGDFREGTFTLADLFVAVDHHITKRREYEAENYGP